MVEHAAKTTDIGVGSDGRTGYRRWKGKDFRAEIPEFGEQIFYLPRKCDMGDKSMPMWSYGTFAGVVDDSNEMQIAVQGSVKVARDVRRHVRQEHR